jgi:cytochrome c peroxidase
VSSPILRRVALVAAFCGLAALGLGVALGAGRKSHELSPMARLGARLFEDTSLSASGRMSCATCHDRARAFAAPDDRAVPLGGAALESPGLRNAPSLMYSAFNPPFSFDEEGAPTGGLDRDGRAADLAAQARDPLLTDFEMGNASVADVVAKMRASSYASEFRAVFGDDALANDERAFASARLALQQFLREDTATFAPFNSRYDRFLGGKPVLSEQEQRGLALFEDPEQGNCAACHPSRPAADGTPPLFTDFTYDNIGVPRNPDIPTNADPAYFDLGLCGGLRTDLRDRRDLCGAFKVPTLRNVALTAPYFHNGRFRTLREVVDFYVRRDTDPAEWYPAGPGGTVHKYDDLPPEYADNVNDDEVPYDREPGDAPALTPQEIDDVVAFLETLTDEPR